MLPGLCRMGPGKATRNLNASRGNDRVARPLREAERSVRLRYPAEPETKSNDVPDTRMKDTDEDESATSSVSFPVAGQEQTRERQGVQINGQTG